MIKINLSNKTKKNLKNIVYNCNGEKCNLCVDNCLMLKKYIKTPKKYFENILDNEKLEKKIVFSCHFCNNCSKVCPKSIDLSKAFKVLRKDLNEQEEDYILKSHKGVYFHNKIGNSNILTKTKEEINKVAFMPGCALSSYRPDIVKKAFDYLKSIYKDIGPLLKCCSKPLDDLGDKEEFNKQFEKLAKEVKKRKIKKLITSCPNCHKVLKESSLDIEIKTIWDVFLDNKLYIDINANIRKELKHERFDLNHPCVVNEYPILKEKIDEFIEKLDYNINQNIEVNCCGMGGMVHVSNHEVFKDKKDKKALSFKNNMILNYCAACNESVSSLKKFKSYHILELVFDQESIINNKSNNPNFLKKWHNRFKTKYLIN